MLLTRQQFEANIVNKGIFYFCCEALPSTVPHYFILIGRQSNGTLILSCCTSQFETVKRLIEKRRLPYETLVYIKSSDVTNPFTKDTYINCNEYFEYNTEEIMQMYDDGEIDYIGVLPDYDYEQIIIGFHKSMVIEEETKDNLIKPEDF